MSRGPGHPPHGGLWAEQALVVGLGQGVDGGLDLGPQEGDAVANVGKHFVVRGGSTCVQGGNNKKCATP